MRILIVDQCSGRKSYPEDSAVCDIETVDRTPISTLLDRPDLPGIEARDLYIGRQQRHVTEAVRMLRIADFDVNRVFVSAGFGVVDDDTRLPPYDVTFHEMTRHEIEDRSNRLGIPDDIIDVVSVTPPYDIVFLPLGADYYQALDLDRLIAGSPTSTTLVLFNQESVAEDQPNVVSIPARTEQAKEYGEVTVALKGEFLRRFARQAAGSTPSSPEEIVEYCQSDSTIQSGLDSQ